MCIWLTESVVFKILTSFVIIGYLVCLGTNDFTDHTQDSNRQTWRMLYKKSRIYFSIFFGIETLLNIIAKGMYQQSASYLRNPDGLINFTVIVLILSISQDMSVFFVFRIVFLMQMLSLYQIFDFGWKLVSLFIKAFFQISAIIFLTFTFLTLFSILGTNLWYNSMDKRCRLTEFPSKHLLHIDGQDVWPIN